jgi:hypothetical protein
MGEQQLVYPYTCWNVVQKKAAAGIVTILAQVKCPARAPLKHRHKIRVDAVSGEGHECSSHLPTVVARHVT